MAKMKVCSCPTHSLWRERSRGWASRLSRDIGRGLHNDSTMGRSYS